MVTKKKQARFATILVHYIIFTAVFKQAVYIIRKNKG